MQSTEPTPQEQQHALAQLQQITDNSNEVLASFTTAFPFTLFPDTITVDRTQITITHRRFFFVGEVVSIRVEDMLNVTAQVGPFFGSVDIASRFFDTSPTPTRVERFWREDALQLKALINGLIVASRTAVNLNVLSKDQLVRELVSLGQSAQNESP